MPFSSLIARLILLGAACGACGCAASPRYNVADLPASLHAPTIRGARYLDVTQYTQPGSGREQISEGDLLKVTVAAGLNSKEVTELLVRVDERGFVLLPEIGPVRVEGLSLAQAERQIAIDCVQKDLYRRPMVTVAMEVERTNRVIVSGAVEKPGVVELPRKSSSVIEAIVAAGGFAEDAGTKISVRKPGGELIPRFAEEGSSGGDIQLTSGVRSIEPRKPEFVCFDLSKEDPSSAGKYLPDGSVVTVEKLEPKPIEVVGLVRKPGRYDYPLGNDIHLLGAIAEAGGLTSKLANEIQILRTDPRTGEQIIINATVWQAKNNLAANVKLAPGDVVSVEPNIGTAAVDLLQIIRFGIGSSVQLF